MSPLTPFHKTLKGSNPAAKLVYNISQWESASTSARCDIHPQVTSPWGTTGSLSHVTVFVKNSTAQTTPHPLLFPSIFCVCVRADATRCKHWCQLVLGRRLGLLKHIFWDFLVRWLCKASEVFCVCVVGGGKGERVNEGKLRDQKWLCLMLSGLRDALPKLTSWS